MKKHEEKTTIFEFLFEKEICFAVNVSLNTFKIKSIESNSRDYFIIVLKKDIKDLKGMGFHRTNDYPNIFERDLSNIEILEFKKNIDKFFKVKHTKDGRVYELKNNSFKKLYESDKSELILS